MHNHPDFLTTLASDYQNGRLADAERRRMRPPRARARLAALIGAAALSAAALAGSVYGATSPSPGKIATMREAHSAPSSHVVRQTPACVVRR